MSTYNVPDDHQPFEIINGILQTSLTMHNNSKYKINILFEKNRK